MVDRVEALGGEIAIASRLGEGTSLMANIPLGPTESPGGQSNELTPVET